MEMKALLYMYFRWVGMYSIVSLYFYSGCGEGGLVGLGHEHRIKELCEVGWLILSWY